MAVRYDDFFQWLKDNYSGSQISIQQEVHPNQDYIDGSGPDIALLQVPKAIQDHPYKGLELLAEKGFVVSAMCFIAGNQNGLVIGAEKNSMKDFQNLPFFRLQVFEVSEGRVVKNDQFLPLVARISIPNSHVHVEYCASAPKYWNGHK